MTTKRITLNLTSAEFELMYSILRKAADEIADRPEEYPGEHAHADSLWEKVQLNYARNGCP